jgi:hypothetical protein
LIVCSAFVHKYRWALLFGVAGGILWTIKAVQLGLMDLVAIEVIIVVLQIRGYFAWKR